MMDTFYPDFHPRYSENQRRCKGDQTPCFICGKGIIPGPRTWWSRTYGGAELCTDEYADANPAGDTGNYPIGNDCYRALPEEAKAFVRRA